MTAAKDASDFELDQRTVERTTIESRNKTTHPSSLPLLNK